MNEDVGRAIVDRKILFLKTLKPLAKISRLSYVKWSPAAVFRLFGIDVIGRPWIKRSVNGINLIFIFLAGLAGPIDMGISFSTLRTLCFVATT